jgi:high-affinity nickel-transport protein
MPLTRLTLPGLTRPSQWRLPRYLSAVPLPALRLIGLLVLINGIVWAAAGVLLRAHHPPPTTTYN